MLSPERIYLWEKAGERGFSEKEVPRTYATKVNLEWAGKEPISASFIMK